MKTYKIFLKNGSTFIVDTKRFLDQDFYYRDVNMLLGDKEDSRPFTIRRDDVSAVICINGS